MSLFRAAAGIVGDIGFGVIKHTGRMAIGGGKAIVGVIIEDEEMIENGLKGVANGTLGLGLTLTRKALTGDPDSEESEDNFGLDYEE